MRTVATASEHSLDRISGPYQAEEALVIESLIRAYVPEWTGEIDYSSIRRLSAELIDDPLKHRYAGNIWRGRSLDAGTEYMLFLEYLDRPERHIALQTTVNIGLAAQEFFGRTRNWSAATDIWPYRVSCLTTGMSRGTLRRVWVTCFASPTQARSDWSRRGRERPRHPHRLTCLR